MKQINITDEMYNSLMELSKELNTQSHRSTAMPYFFQIQTTKKVAVPEGNGTIGYAYDGSTIETEEEINQVIFEYKDEKIPLKEIAKMNNYEQSEILNEAGWREVNFDYKEEYQNAFMTEKACKEHIRLNNYHYNKPIDYLQHAFRNPELELVLKFLCELSGGELHK